MDDFKKLAETWRQQETKSAMATASEIESMASKNISISARTHRVNIAVFAVTLTSLIVLLFIPLQFTFSLSYIGLAAMVGILAVRIILEIWSRNKLNKVSVADGSLSYSSNMLQFYRWRRKLNGIVSIMMVTIYIVGFSLILPEFWHKIPEWTFYLIVVSFSILAIVITKVAVVGSRKELRHLKELSDIVDDLSKG